MELTGQNNHGQEANQKSPEFSKILVLIREGRLRDAESELLAFVASPQFSSGDKLNAYGHLIRVAAELRSFDKIPAYIEEIKKIPLTSNLDRIRFSRCMYMTGISWHHSGSVEKARQNFNQALEIALDVRDEELIFLNQLALVELLRVEGQYQQVLNQIEPLKVAAEASKNPSHVSIDFCIDLQKKGTRVPRTLIVATR